VRNLVKHYQDVEDETLVTQLIDNTVDSLEENERLLHTKAQKVNWSMWMLLVGLILTLLTGIIQGG